VCEKDTLYFIDKTGRKVWKSEKCLDTAKKALEKKLYYDAFTAANDVLRMTPANAAAKEIVAKAWEAGMKSAIDCKVMKVKEKDTIMLSVGKADGAAEGRVFVVFRGTVEVGRARVTKVGEDTCEAVFFEKKRTVKAGDDAGDAPWVHYWKNR
jgi:hypothetical protein